MNFEDLPCYENAQRLARIETKLETISATLADPCGRCQNKDELTRLAAEVKWHRRVGYGLLSGAATLFLVWLERTFK